MKKTLFLSAILGAALCSSAFAETYTSIADNTTITTASGDTITGLTMGNNSAFVIGGATTTTGNIKVTGSNSASITIAEGGSVDFNNAGSSKYHLQLDGSASLTLRGGEFDLTKATPGLAIQTNATLTLDEGVTLKSKRSFYSSGTAKNGTLVMKNDTKALFNDDATLGGLVVDGNAAFSATNAYIGTLTINDGGKLTVGSGTTMDISAGSDYFTNETVRTSGNGFSTADYERNFGSSLVADGATIKVNNNAATFTDGVLRVSNIQTTTYYVNEAASVTTLSGATKLVVNGTGDGVFAMNGAGYGNVDVTIKSGKVTTTRSWSDGFTTGDVTVLGGGTLAVVDGGQDALGWDNSATKSISLLGDSETSKATLDLSYNGTGSVTMTTNLNLGGHSQIIGTGAFNSFGGAITVDGEDNTISAGLVLRRTANINVKDGADLVISGPVTASTESGNGATYTMTKTGNGVLTISGSISGSSNNHTAVINGDGANTILSGNSIANSTLSNVKLTGDALTLTGTMAMSNVTFTNALVNNSTLTLSGTVNYTGELENGTMARTEGNGLGYTTTKGTLISRGSGSTNKDAVTTWQINGESTDVSYADGALTKITGNTDTYYINNQGAELTAATTGTLNAGTYTGMTAKLVVGTSGAAKADGVTLTVNGTTELATTDYIEVYHNSTLNLEDTAHVSANSGSNKALWLHEGSAVTMATGATVSANGVDFKGGTITATGDTQIGGGLGTPSNATITGSAITVNDGKTLREHNVVGGSITAKGNATINAALSSTDKTDLTVVSGATATFGNKDVALKNLTLEGGATLTLGSAESHDNTLSLTRLDVTGSDATVNANLDLTGSFVNLHGNALTMGCNVVLDGTTIFVTYEQVEYLVYAGQDIVLFTDVESLTLGSFGPYTSPMSLERNYAHIVFDGEGNQPFLDMQDVFVNLNADKTVTLSFTARNELVPEPATATLSLLALAGLMARRRRH